MAINLEGNFPVQKDECLYLPLPPQKYFKKYLRILENNRTLNYG